MKLCGCGAYGGFAHDETACLGGSPVQEPVRSWPIRFAQVAICGTCGYAMLCGPFEPGDTGYVLRCHNPKCAAHERRLYLALEVVMVPEVDPQGG